MTEQTLTRRAEAEAEPRDFVALAWAILALLAGLALTVLGILWLVRGLSTPVPAAGDSDVLRPLPRIVSGGLALALGAVITVRYARLLYAIFTRSAYIRARETMRIDLIQLFLLLMLATVLFPVLWILSMSLDPRDFSRPSGLTLIPPGASLDAYRTILTQPSPNPVTFLQLLRNSLLVAGGTAALAVVVGTSAAYAFSRLSFPGRRIGMLMFVLVLMIPPGGTLAPLFVLLNSIRVDTTILGMTIDANLRTTLWGLAVAYTSTALPFAIWNMKGFIDSLPYDLEEAAQIDGATRFQSFVRVILPLAVPGMAVTALWGFLTGWSEFILAWTFLTEPTRFTLPMVLRGMVGQYASGTPWSQFAAMSIVMSIPPVLIFFALQRFLVSGLAVGGVKG